VATNSIHDNNRSSRSGGRTVITTIVILIIHIDQKCEMWTFVCVCVYIFMNLKHLN